MFKRDLEITVAAEFFVNEKGEYELQAIYTKYASQKHIDLYDVVWSKADDGYLYRNSANCRHLELSGKYWVAFGQKYKEVAVRFSDRKVEARNSTECLLDIPEKFQTPDLSGSLGILAWLEIHGREAPYVYCSECEDQIPEDIGCDHIAWCDECSEFHTPDYQPDHQAVEQ